MRARLLGASAAPRQGRGRHLPAQHRGRSAALELNRPLVDELLAARRPRSRSVLGGTPRRDRARWTCCAGRACVREAERDRDTGADRGARAAARDGRRAERIARPRRRSGFATAAAALRRAARSASRPCARGCPRCARACATRIAERVGATRRRRSTPSASSRSSCCSLQDGRRGGARPPRQSCRPRSCRCSIRRSPPGGGSIS